MWSEVEVPEPVKRLLARQRDEVLAEVQRRHRRALADNPEGSALVLGALGQALLVGVRAQCRLDGLPTRSLQADASAWDAWQQTREETPERLYWPHELSRAAPEAVEEAGELLDSAAAELDLRRRERSDLYRVGEECAEAGAALARTLARGPAAESAPVEATLGTAQPMEADGTVRVALASNQAECELLQGRLQASGIPSMWRRTGSQLPYLFAAGYREIYVPASAAAEAQVLLATLAGAASTEAPEPSSRPVGLERTGVRLMGKATATLMLLGWVTGAIYIYLSDNTGLAIAALAALAILIAVAVTWSERGSVRK